MSQFTSKRRRNNLPSMVARRPSFFATSPNSPTTLTYTCACGHKRFTRHGRRYGNQPCSEPGCDCKGYVKPPPTEQEVEMAADLGPSAVRADAPLPELVRIAGFRPCHVEDLTTDFEATTESVWEGRCAAETELRAAEGDEAYDAETSKKARVLEGIRRGLLRRTLVVADAL